MRTRSRNSDISCPYAVYGDPSTSVYKVLHPHASFFEADADGSVPGSQALSLKANLDRSSGPKVRS